MREIELKPSRRLGLLLAGMLLLALAALYLAALPGGLQVALVLLITGFSAWRWRRISTMERLRIAADGRLQCLDEAGEWRAAEVLGDSFVSTALIVLRYRIEGRPARSLILLPDSAAADDLRRLRVSLRWARHTRSDTASPDAG